MVTVRGAYGYDVDEASNEAGLECRDESLAVQSQAEDADINVIVRRFGISGQLPSVPVPPSYADFSEAVTDYRDALELVMAADRSFAALSADVRLRFDNDPAKFLDFVENPANLAELRKMGLAVSEEGSNDVEASGGSSTPPGGGAREGA